MMLLKKVDSMCVLCASETVTIPQIGERGLIVTGAMLKDIEENDQIAAELEALRAENEQLIAQLTGQQPAVGQVGESVIQDQPGVFIE